MLVQLTYASRISKALGSEDIKNILKHSQTNNQADGVTGALCLSSGIFLQILEGDRNTVNRIYHKILQDSRHKDPAILDYREITARQFSEWSMGLITRTDDNKQLFLKYSSDANFDPYSMGAKTLRGFFDEVVDNVRWLRKNPD
ncbi:BLUF domain-containing protein [Kangiella koreensis]|uniref:BLUF domain protein n=1 Tax=Kangiella koreensis (strain DSM 16069 / JCM 12317 / KCTC 12182 / SW-125) TaxID=523791 RepID=C7R790_KANKD|nr:BLUF domain-containing protein [Kangiella koreensis]ACV27546.1 BLUF domain protein [Kangiella koreensis DSM 16069]